MGIDVDGGPNGVAKHIVADHRTPGERALVE